MCSILTIHSVLDPKEGLFSGSFWVGMRICHLAGRWVGCFLVLLSFGKCPDGSSCVVLCITLITDLSDLQERSKHLVLLDGLKGANDKFRHL